MSFFKERVIQRNSIPELDERVGAFPKNCLIELSNACNHACVFCQNSFMQRDVGHISKDVYSRFVREAAKLGLEEVGLYATGEPFLTKHLDWYVREAKMVGLRRVYVTTNGVLATLPRVKAAVSAGLDSIKFSINAGTRDSYALIHGRDEFEDVVANIKAIYEWKVRENVPLQLLGSYILTLATEGEVSKHKERFGKWLEDILYLRPLNQGGRLANVVGQVAPSAGMQVAEQIEPCAMLWNRVHLTCEGYLTACCVDYEHDLTYADYANSDIGLMEQWNNPIMVGLRRRHIERNLDNTICKACLLGTTDPYRPLTDFKLIPKKVKQPRRDVLTRIAIVRAKSDGENGA